MCLYTALCVSPDLYLYTALFVSLHLYLNTVLYVSLHLYFYVWQPSPVSLYCSNVNPHLIISKLWQL
jgi:hypothetical protein